MRSHWRRFVGEAGLHSWGSRYALDPHGTVSQRISWPEVVDIVRTRKFERFGRLPEDQALYHRRIREMRDEFVSVGDYVLHHKFGYPFQQGANTKKLVVPPSADVKRNRALWLPNDFPYALERDIEHYLIWSLRPFEESGEPPSEGTAAAALPVNVAIEAIISRHINTFTTDYVYFINPPVLRSVPNVSHVHVMAHPR